MGAGRFEYCGEERVWDRGLRELGIAVHGTRIDISSLVMKDSGSRCYGIWQNSMCVPRSISSYEIEDIRSFTQPLPRWDNHAMYLDFAKT